MCSRSRTESEELELLTRQFPLDGWQYPRQLVRTTRVGPVLIRVAGLCTKNRSGTAVMAGAGTLIGSPIPRAYFELIERAATVDATSRSDQNSSWQVWDPDRNRLGVLPHHCVFPPSTRTWQYARSNGVAAGQTWKQACQHAQWELIERDRVLRSWYGKLAPLELAVPTGLLPDALNRHYEFRAYCFPDADRLESASSVSVAGIFGFPRRRTVPLVYGFGARTSLAEALTMAGRECLQRLGFLWGERIVTRLPRFAMTPHYHQDYFLCPASQPRLRAWLSGANQSLGAQIVLDPVPSTVLSAGPGFVDLTPDRLRGTLHVAKALPRGELPLVFGRGHPQLRGEIPVALSVHPVA